MNQLHEVEQHAEDQDKVLRRAWADLDACKEALKQEQHAAAIAAEAAARALAEAQVNFYRVNRS